jgi:hypothetical protein
MNNDLGNSEQTTSKALRASILGYGFDFCLVNCRPVVLLSVNRKSEKHVRK